MKKEINILTLAFVFIMINFIIAGTILNKKMANNYTKNTNNLKSTSNVIADTNKKIIIPNIVIEDKVYDGNEAVHILSISVTNLEDDEYTVVYAMSSSPNAGKRIAIIRLRLSDEKFKDYTFDNGEQEKEFTIQFEITKINIKPNDLSEDVTVVYDGNYHTIKVNITSDLDIKVKFMDSNGEYTLDEPPKYQKPGVYIIKYKVSVDENYNDHYSERKLVIEDTIPYKINNYKVDETKKYISLIPENTLEEIYKSNFILNYGYTVETETKKVNNKNILYTGSIVKIQKGTKTYTKFTNIVSGDITGEGTINSSDLLRIRRHLLGEKTLSGIYFIAADVNHDDSINSSDLLKMRQHSLGNISIK